MNKTILSKITGIAIACFSTLMLGGCMVSGGEYYAQIDSSKAEENVREAGGIVDFSGAGGCNYRINLPACDENGDCQDLTFGLDELPTDGIYVKLEVQHIRGVVNAIFTEEKDVPSSAISALQHEQSVESSDSK
ncbi:DUF1093 domain-containing protein [Erysipelotrichaceae bacterium 51-3]